MTQAAATVRFIGNATLVIEVGGVRILTDPNFLHAGNHAHIGYGLTTRRLRDPAIELDDVGLLDAVLLSHDHGDHFDHEVEARLDRARAGHRGHLDGAGGVELLRIIDPAVAFPIHYEEYTVMKSPLSDFLDAAEAAGLRDRIRVIERGGSVALG